FFFAGHGSVSAGSFYMLLRDSTPNGQSMSALSLADVFRTLNEAAPHQSNIIIDACESGGLIADLGVLLKPEMLGNAGTPALTLVATSAQDQFAKESEEGGFGTNAILDCIEGRDFIQDSTSVLDLVEIGRRVSTRLISEKGQSPIVWGLNLYGPPSFCRNPRYASDPSAPLRSFIQSWPAGNDESIKINHDALWAAYSSTSGAWNSEKFSQVVSTVLAPCTSNPSVLSKHADRLAATFLLKAQYSADPFRIPQVAATLAACLLPHINSAPVEASAQHLLSLCSSELLKANASLITDLSYNKYALLSTRGGG
ncbi:caspase family protein, partial [Azotobacter chroococcum]|nr:caspase family protein [Azotobacter chroococcum]